MHFVGVSIASHSLGPKSRHPLRRQLQPREKSDSIFCSRTRLRYHQSPATTRSLNIYFEIVFPHGGYLAASDPPKMVCSKCAKLSKGTTLATPGVKKKSEMYYGSPAASSSSTASGPKKSATLGNTGVTKVSAGAALGPHACLSEQPADCLSRRASCCLKAPRTRTRNTQGELPLPSVSGVSQTQR